jgi:predicted ArsR family transcriptional regulator
MAEALSEEGIVFDVAEDSGAFVLSGHACPCPRAADRQPHPCAHDQRLLSLLLGADVTYVEPFPGGGDGSCAYRVSEREGSEALSASETLV